MSSAQNKEEEVIGIYYVAPNCVQLRCPSTVISYVDRSVRRIVDVPKDHEVMSMYPYEQLGRKLIDLGWDPFYVGDLSLFLDIPTGPKTMAIVKVGESTNPFS